MTQANSPQTGLDTPRRRWPRVLLALSLTLNLVVIGLVAGAVWRDGRDARRFPPPDHGVMRATGFGPFIDAMPRAARNRMGEALRRREGHFTANRGALAAEWRDMVAILRADPFDPQAFEALLMRQQARADARVKEGRAVLVEQINAMPSAERARFADALEQRFARALEHGGNGPHGGGMGPD